MSYRDTGRLAHFADVVSLRIVEAEGDLDAGAVEARSIFQRCPHHIEALWQIIERIQHDRYVSGGELRGNTPRFLAALDDCTQLLALGERDHLADIRRTVHIEDHGTRAPEALGQRLSPGGGQ